MGKYDKHFITQDKPDFKLPSYRYKPGKKDSFRIVCLDGEVFPGADFCVEAVWIWPGREPQPGPDGEPGAKAHTHPFDEVIAFMGTNPDDIHDLCGEIELWIDGEQNIIDKSFMAFIPAGMVHCPMNIRRVDRPIFHIVAGNSPMYE